jgi:hypothetical protein
MSDRLFNRYFRTLNAGAMNEIQSISRIYHFVSMTVLVNFGSRWCHLANCRTAGLVLRLQKQTNYAIRWEVYATILFSEGFRLLFNHSRKTSNCNLTQSWVRCFVKSIQVHASSREAQSTFVAKSLEKLIIFVYRHMSTRLPGSHSGTTREHNLSELGL